MTFLLNANTDTPHEENFVELEYLIGEMLASGEFSLLVLVISVWFCLRLYWFGLNIISYFADGQTLD